MLQLQLAIVLAVILGSLALFAVLTTIGAWVWTAAYKLQKKREEKKMEEKDSEESGSGSGNWNEKGNGN